MTDQLYKAYGYKMIFALETLDIFQADESKRALSLQSFVQAVTTVPQVAKLGMGILGYDLTGEQKKELDEIIKVKEEQKEEMQEQMAAGKVDMNGKPIPQKIGAEDKEDRDSERPETEKKPPRRKSLAPDQIESLATWQKNALRWFNHSNGEKNGADWRTD